MDCKKSVNEYLDEIAKEKEEEWEIKVTDQECVRIPDSDQIPLEKPHWLRIRNVAAVYADMVGSTYVTLRKYQRFSTTARIYQVFTGTLARIMNGYDVAYMDIQGDGILGIWDGDSARYPAFCASVTLKTFVSRWFKGWVEKKTDGAVSVDVHIGIDEYPVHVKRVGMRGGWRRKEVWAGQPINLAVKLCDMAGADEIVVSDRVYDAFKLLEIYESCECPSEEYPEGRAPLWTEEEVDEEQLGISKVHRLHTHWCKIHGNDYCSTIMSLAEE